MWVLDECQISSSEYVNSDNEYFEGVLDECQISSSEYSLSLFLPLF